MKSCWQVNAKGDFVACDIATQFSRLHIARFVRIMDGLNISSAHAATSDNRPCDTQQKDQRQNADAATASSQRIARPPCRKHKRCVEVSLKRFDAILTHIQKLLQKLSREQRQTILLRRFSQPQRLALERWMLRRKAVESLSPGRMLSDLKSLQTRPKKTTIPFRSARELPACDSGQRRNERLIRNASEVVATQPDSNPPGIVRVVRGGGRYHYYTAFCTVGSLELFSKTCCELSTARRCRAILAAIKHHAMASDGSFEERFRKAVLMVSRETGAEGFTLGLKFCVRLRVLWISTPLRTAAYRIFSGTEMEEGLRICRRLEDARGLVAPHHWNVCRQFTAHELARAWAHLQSEYLKAMVEAGRRPETILQKLEVLTRKRENRQQKYENHWSQHRLAKEKRLLSRKRKWPLDATTVAIPNGRIESAIQCWLTRWAKIDAKLESSCGQVRLRATALHQ